MVCTSKKSLHGVNNPHEIQSVQSCKFPHFARCQRNGRNGRGGSAFVPDRIEAPNIDCTQSRKKLKPEPSRNKEQRARSEKFISQEKDPSLQRDAGLKESFDCVLVGYGVRCGGRVLSLPSRKTLDKLLLFFCSGDRNWMESFRETHATRISSVF